MFKERLSSVRGPIKKLGAQAFLLTNPADYFYLTGFTGDESAVMLTPRDVYIISDRRFEEQIKHECPWARTYMRRGLLNAEIAKACADLKVRKLAVQSENLTLADKAEIERLAKPVKTVATPAVVRGLRKLKDATEVAAMRKAIRVAEVAFEAARRTIKPGQTELHMAAQLEFEMKSRGASGPSFPTICAEGPNAALPHAHPGKRKARRGSAILFDWGARVGGYCSDLTRMVFVGSIPPRIRTIYRIVLDAQLAAISDIRPGRRMCEVDAVARRWIERAGYEKQFSHGLGHGLGLDVHEAPSLSWRSDEELVAGMIVTVEPGIYLPGVGGVRIEDDVLVTPTGCKVLTHLDKRMEDAVI